MPAHRTEIPAALRDRAFTTAEARAAGVGKAVLQGPSVQRVARGVYRVASAERSVTADAVAALKLMPEGTLIAGVTALQVYGVDLGTAGPLRFCTTTAFRSRRTGVQVARLQRLPARRGAVVAPADALLQACAELDLLQVVTAGDWLLRLGVVDLTALRRRLASAAGRGARTARRAADLIRERVDSPRETWLRLLLVLSGLPEPEVNPPVGTEFRFVGFVDLVYRRHQVMVEYEGDQHRAKGQWNSDIGRYEELAAEGWIVIRVTAADRWRPTSVAYRVHQALATHGYGGPAPAYGSEWMALFAT